MKTATSMVEGQGAFPKRDGLIDAITSLHNEYSSIGISTSELIAKSNEAHLGQYTVEQEADELAAEILAFIGVDPVAAFLEYNIDSECAKRHASQWRRDGVFEVEPIHDYFDPHHSFCFGLFDVDQEKNGHNYQAPSTGWRQLSDFSGWQQLETKASWKSLQDLAKREIEAPPH